MYAQRRFLIGGGAETKCSSQVEIDDHALLWFHSSFGRIIHYKGCFVALKSFFSVYFADDASYGAHSSEVASRSSLSKDFHKLESPQQSAKTRPVLQQHHVC